MTLHHRTRALRGATRTLPGAGHELSRISPLPFGFGRQLDPCRIFLRAPAPRPDPFPLRAIPLIAAEAIGPTPRYSDMSLMSKREAVPSMGTTSSSTLVVVAGTEPLRRRLVAAMAAVGCDVPAVARQDGLAEYELDARSVLIFSCDVDLPADVTALRRMRKSLPEPAIVVVSPRSTATAVRRTL